MHVHNASWNLLLFSRSVPSEQHRTALHHISVIAQACSSNPDGDNAPSLLAPVQRIHVDGDSARMYLHVHSLKLLCLCFGQLAGPC